MRIAVTFVACALVWDSTFRAIRFGNEATLPVWAATIRLTLASVLLFGIAAVFRMPSRVAEPCAARPCGDSSTSA